MLFFSVTKQEKPLQVRTELCMTQIYCTWLTYTYSWVAALVNILKSRSGKKSISWRLRKCLKKFACHDLSLSVDLVQSMPCLFNQDLVRNVHVHHKFHCVLTTAFIIRTIHYGKASATICNVLLSYILLVGKCEKHHHILL